MKVNLFKRIFIHPIKRRIAKYYLIVLRKFTDIKVIGITGSAGKTTTKEMLASILKLDGKTVYTIDNIDPVYNIPTTILKCNFKTKYLILEMGVEYPGEMDFYLWLAKPDVGVITNIHATHTQFFGDIGGVFKEKRKLVLHLPKEGAAILYNQDNQLKKLKGKLNTKEIWFGNGTRIMSSLEGYTKDFKTHFNLIINQNAESRIKVTIPILGEQFVMNALAASAVAHHFKVPINIIKKGLESFSLQEHRMTIKKLKGGAIVIDDSYNNNPFAAEEALKTYSGISRNKDGIIIFGDMLELGNWEEKYHKEIGEQIGKMLPCKLICVGFASKVITDIVARSWGKQNIYWFSTADEIMPVVRSLMTKNSIILIKGSRSIGLDKVVEGL